jgi:hypothetical protein
MTGFPLWVWFGSPPSKLDLKMVFLSLEHCVWSEWENRESGPRLVWRKKCIIDMNVRMCIVVGANGKQNRRRIFRSLNKWWNGSSKMNSIVRASYSLKQLKVAWKRIPRPRYQRKNIYDCNEPTLRPSPISAAHAQAGRRHHVVV